MRNRTLALLALIGVSQVVILSGLAVAQHHETQLALEADIESADIIDKNITAIRIRVHNEGSHSIEPVFRAPTTRWHIQNSWNILHGPALLQPGEAASYVIQPPGERAMPHESETGVVVISDSGSQQRRVWSIDYSNLGSSGGDS
jgi:hypothetical protein